jgi:hypothetical protein
VTARLLVGLLTLLLLVGGGAQIPADSPIGDEAAQLDAAPDAVVTAVTAPEPPPRPVRIESPAPSGGAGRVHLDSVFRPPRLLAAG